MATRQSSKNVKWVEGLRGIASVLVLITHIARAFDYPLFFPADEASRAPRLLQLPILRIPAQGRIGVPIFAFLTGFICALNPLKLARKETTNLQLRRRRQRQQQQQRQYYHSPSSISQDISYDDETHTWANTHTPAIRSLAKSAFRRPPRLILPAAFATFISFLFTLCGGYMTANICDSFWVRYDAPIREAHWGLEVKRFVRTLLTTWTDRDNPYDRHQWAMLPLLMGAFQVYLVVLCTMGSRFRWRMGVHLLLLGYWWLNQEPFAETFGSMITLGTLLADLSLHRPTQTFLARHHRLFTLVVAPFLILVGLLFGSYPQEHEDWSPWSLWLHKTFVDLPNGGLLIPKGTDPQRRFSAFGIQLCCLAIFSSSWLREALSHRVLLWLGHHSFAVYLTHGTILRTVGIWVAYGLHPTTIGAEEGGEENQDEEFVHVKSREAVLAAIVVFVMLSYTVAWGWMRWVDTACARATQWFEAKVFQEENKEDEEDDRYEKQEEYGDAEKGYGRGSLSELLLPLVVGEQDHGSAHSHRDVVTLDERMDASRRLFADLGIYEDVRSQGSRGLLG